MKKKIGFIDLFIDEWHANNYPAWFRSAARKDEFELGYAWEEKNNGGRALADWCKEFNMTPAASLAEVVEKSDCICVLAPSNPEVHAQLADLALRSGKPVYIDKPFAPSKKVAEEIFALAKEYNTPLMSSSALRYGNELISGELQELKPEIFCTTGGGRSFDEYGIHQLEMIVSIMGTNVKDINLVGDSQKLALTINFADGRIAQAAYNPTFPYTVSAGNATGSKVYATMGNFFPNLIDAMLEFFATGVSPIPAEETITIAALLEESCKLLHNK
jgi:hypothetical protein